MVLKPGTYRELVNVYVDGPNLLGAVSDLRKGRRVWLDPVELARRIADQTTQEIKRIYYAETRYQENRHHPDTFRRQQSFFGHIFKYIRSGVLTHIEGVYRTDEVKVPQHIIRQLKPDIQRLVESLVWYRPIEKGGDVGLAVQLVRDAFLGKFDRAILVTADQDFSPAVNIVLGEARKPLAIAYVHNTFRDAMALRNRCEQAGFIQITRKMIDVCELRFGEGQ